MNGQFNGPRVRPDSRRVVDVEDTYPAQGVVPVQVGSVPGVLVVASIQCKNGLLPYLKKVGNVVTDGTGADKITWSVRVNGAEQPNLTNVANELSDPGKAGDELPYELPVSPSALVELVAKNSDTANTHTVVGRLIVIYEDPNPWNS